MTQHSTSRPTADLVDHCLQHYAPALRPLWAELQGLQQRGPAPVVAAMGDYNVGKSSLLNALIGEPVFSVADRRETRQLASHQHAGYCWLDTPGLDADLDGADDRHALAAIPAADLLLYLHNINNGELSPRQLALLHTLQTQTTGTKWQLVLTRIDECRPDDLAQITARIQQQTGGAPLVLVSSQRYLAGLRQQQPKLTELSGLPALHRQLSAWQAQVAAQRAQQYQALLTTLRGELTQAARQAQQALTGQQQQQAKQRQTLVSRLRALQSRLTASEA